MSPNVQVPTYVESTLQRREHQNVVHAETGNNVSNLGGSSTWKRCAQCGYMEDFRIDSPAAAWSARVPWLGCVLMAYYLNVVLMQSSTRNQATNTHRFIPYLLPLRTFSGMIPVSAVRYVMVDCIADASWKDDMVGGKVPGAEDR